MLSRAERIPVRLLLAAALLAAGTIAVALLSLRRGEAGTTNAMALDADPATPGIQTSRVIDTSVSSQFTIAIEAADVVTPYQGYQWQIAFPSDVLSPVSATSNDDGSAVWDNSSSSTLFLCASATESLTSPHGVTWYGNGAGCVGLAPVMFSGRVAEITLSCDVSGPVVVPIAFVTQAESEFGTTFLAQGGDAMPTALSNIDVHCGTGSDATPTATRTPSPSNTPTITPTTTLTPSPTVSPTPIPPSDMALDADADVPGIQTSRTGAFNEFTIAVAHLEHVVPYGGFQWQIAFPDAVLSFFSATSNDDGDPVWDGNSTGFECTQHSSGPFGSAGEIGAGNTIGCYAQLSGAPSTSYVGQLARVTLTCDVHDGSLASIRFIPVGEPGLPLFIGSSFFQAPGAPLPTQLSDPITVQCGPGEAPTRTPTPTATPGPAVLALDGDPSPAGIQSSVTAPDGTVTLALRVDGVRDAYHGYRWRIAVEPDRFALVSGIQNDDGDALWDGVGSTGITNCIGPSVIPTSLPYVVFGGECTGENGTTFSGELARVTLSCISLSGQLEQIYLFPFDPGTGEGSTLLDASLEPLETWPSLDGPPTGGILDVRCGDPTPTATRTSTPTATPTHTPENAFELALDADPGAPGLQASTYAAGGAATIAIRKTNSPEAFTAYLWQIAFPVGVLQPIASTSNDDGSPIWDSQSTGTTTCVAASFDAQAPPGDVWYGSAGCALPSNPFYVGDIALIDFECLVDDGTLVEVAFVPYGQSATGTAVLVTNGFPAPTILGPSIAVQCGGTPLATYTATPTSTPTPIDVTLDADASVPGIQTSRTLTGGAFTIGIDKTGDEDPYQGYQWQVAFDDGVLSPVSATSNDDGDPIWDATSSFLNLCAPAGVQAGAPAGVVWYGGGAGCVGVAPTTYAGQLARITLACDVDDGTSTTVSFVPMSSSEFGTTLLDSGGALLETVLSPPITIKCGEGTPATSTPTITATPTLTATITATQTATPTPARFTMQLDADADVLGLQMARSVTGGQFTIGLEDVAFSGSYQGYRGRSPSTARC